MEGLAGLAPRLKEFYRDLPTHVQEALLGYRNVNGSLPPGIDGSAIDSRIDSRFQNFVYILDTVSRTVLPKMPGRLLHPILAATWWFFYIFGRTAAGPPFQAACRRIAGNGEPTMNVTVFETSPLCRRYSSCRFCSCCPGARRSGRNTPQRVSRRPVLYPDYAGTVIAPNIAPLNFEIKERGVRFLCERIAGEKGGSVEVSSRDGKIVWPARAWKQLMAQNRGAAVSVTVTVQEETAPAAGSMPCGSTSPRKMWTATSCTGSFRPWTTIT